MTLLLMEGFDSFDIQDAKGRLGVVSSTLTNAVGRDGVGQSVVLPKGFSASSLTLSFPPLDGEPIIVGFSCKLSYSPVNSAIDLFRIRASATTSTSYALKLRLETSGQISFWRGNTLMAISDSPVAMVGWCTLETKVLVANAGSITVRINGADIPGLAGLSIDTEVTSTYSEMGGLFFSSSLSNSGPDIEIDNVYVCDTNGTLNNDFLGEVRIATRYPDADAGPNDFTAVGAGTGKYERVDESAADDDTTYLYSETVGEEESFTFPDLPAEVDTILAVQACSVARKDGAGTRTVKQKITGSSATTVDGDDTGLGDSYNSMIDLLEVDPGTSAAWTEANANAIEMGVEIVS